MWEIHFTGMYASFMAWLLAEDLCKERFGIRDQDPEFQDMMRGFDNKIYEMDKKMWEFGQEADTMGLGDLFRKNQPEVILSKLEQSEKGKEWYKQFMNYMVTDEVGGWRMRSMCELIEPYWLEDPSTPIGIVRDYAHLGLGYDTVIARIRHDNTVSFGAFGACGFEYDPDESDDNIKVYKWTASKTTES